MAKSEDLTKKTDQEVISLLPDGFQITTDRLRPMLEMLRRHKDEIGNLNESIQAHTKSTNETSNELITLNKRLLWLTWILVGIGLITIAIPIAKFIFNL
ncbi:MAG: hypothetical protein ACOCUT_01530 [bacterium]